MTPFVRLMRVAAMVSLVASAACAPTRAGPSLPDAIVERGPGSRGWKIPFAGGHSSPAFADGVLYVGSSDGAVSAFDAATGRTIWRAQTGTGLSRGNVVFISLTDTSTAPRSGARGQIEASPVVVNGTVYVGAYDGYFYALDASTGQPRWTYAVPTRVSARAIVADSIVYFASGDQTIHAVDTRSGKRRWTSEGKVRWGYSSDLMLLANGTIYSTNWSAPNAYVYATDAGTGANRWTASFPGSQTSTPSVSDGVVVASAIVESLGAPGHQLDRVRVYVFDAASGALRWQTDLEPSRDRSEKAVAVNGVVLIQTQQGLSAHDAASGDLKWQYQPRNSSSMWVSGRYAYLVNPATRILGAGAIQCVEIETGALRWTRPAAAEPQEFVAEESGVLYTLASEHYPATVPPVGGNQRPRSAMIAYDANTGNAKWRFAFDTPVISVPLLANGMIYVAASSDDYFRAKSYSGSLVAFDAATGKMRR